RVHGRPSPLGRHRRRGRSSATRVLARRDRGGAPRRRPHRDTDLMPEKLVVGNWKMNPPSVADAVALGRDVAAHGQTGVAVGAAQHAAGEATAVVARQIAADLAEARHASLDRLVIAYEPVWAIGTGTPATGEHASAAARAIRAALKHAGLDGERVPILYGGSV